MDTIDFSNIETSPKPIWMTVGNLVNHIKADTSPWSKIGNSNNYQSDNLFVFAPPVALVYGKKPEFVQSDTNLKMNNPRFVDIYTVCFENNKDKVVFRLRDSTNPVEELFYKKELIMTDKIMLDLRESGSSSKMRNQVLNSIRLRDEIMDLRQKHEEKETFLLQKLKALSMNTLSGEVSRNAARICLKESQEKLTDTKNVDDATRTFTKCLIDTGDAVAAANLGEIVLRQQKGTEKQRRMALSMLIKSAAVTNKEDMLKLINEPLKDDLNTSLGTLDFGSHRHFSIQENEEELGELSEREKSELLL